MVDDVLNISIDSLIENFRNALIAILPSAERIKINWRDYEPHHDWELLAKSLFDIFIRNPIDVDRDRSGDEFPLARFDIDLDSYVEVSYLTLSTDSPRNMAFVRFLSRVNPFDTVQVVHVDPVTFLAGQRSTLPWSEARFALAHRRPTSPVRLLTHITAIE